jgi:hypothetical protein
MSSTESLKTIRRNRLTSNWMVAMQLPGQEPPRPKVKRRPRRLMVLSAALTLIAAMALRTALPTSVAQSHELDSRREAQSAFTANPKPVAECSEQYLRLQLAKSEPRPPDQTVENGAFALTEIQDLGGQRIFLAQCHRGQSWAKFEVVWSKSSKGWHLKQISRQPTG